MKSSSVMVMLALLAVLVMGTLAAATQENAAAVGESKVYFKKCCKNCRTFSGVMVCDDVSSKCPKGCDACRTVQVRPVKTFRCADAVTDDGTCGKC